jgi:hypothetical protein
MTDITELLKLKDSIELVRRRMTSDSIAVNEWRSNLQKLCPHPTTKTTSKYYDGGYDYLSSVRIMVQCTICEKVLESYDDPKHRGHHA